jgi:transposase-like protein
MPKELRYHCNVCKCSFSVTVRTVFHKTKVDLQKWFFAIKQSDLSVRKLAAEINVDKNTANFIQSRIKVALESNPTLIKTLKENI